MEFQLFRSKPHHPPLFTHAIFFIRGGMLKSTFPILGGVRFVLKRLFLP